MKRTPASRRSSPGAAPASPAPAAASRPDSTAGNLETLRRLGVGSVSRIGGEHDAQEASAEHAGQSAATGQARAPPAAGIGQVRVHRTAQAHAAAHTLGARAFTVGRDIYLGPHAPQAESTEGRQLMAHEMAHVAQDDGVLRRAPDPAARGPAFNAALGNGEFARAAKLLGEMTPEDRVAALGALRVTALYALHTAAVAPGESNPVVHDIEQAIARAPRDPAEPAPERPVSQLSAEEKLGRAWGYAKAGMGPAFAKELENLFSPASLAIMAGFAILFVASQVTPVGWAADLAALVLLAATVILLGTLILQILADLIEFFRSVNATSDEQLRASGSALARATARAGVGVIVALLTRGLGRGLGPPRPRPISGFALATGAEGAPAMMPVPATAAEAAPSAVQGLAASYAVMVPPPGGTSSGGGGSGAKPKGPEVFDEISKELGLATEETAARGVASAVEDARAAGFVDAAGQPRGPVDLATQSHGTAPAARGELGLTGAEAQSAHVAPTSGVKGVAGYSRSGASTVLMEPTMHRAFDAHWQQWAMALRRAGRTDVSVGELYAEMLSAIDQIPGMAQSSRNALAWRLQLELFTELGLKPTDSVALPYPNIPPAP